MPHGSPKAEYFQSTRIEKPIDEIFADLNSWTYEICEGETQSYFKIDLTALLPPLSYNGHFLKGVCYTRAADMLLARFPAMKHHFITIASSMCSAFPQAREADALFSTYKNAQRENWFRRTFPERAEKPLIPLADADFVHEEVFSPTPVRAKLIDVLTVSRLEHCKNLPMLCRAVRLYAKKYGRIKLTIVAGRHEANFLNLSSEEQEVMSEIQQVFGEGLEDYVDLIPHVAHSLLPHYYSSAKVCVLGSLVEGANRFLKEAMACNTPVICFKDFNQFVRGNHPIVPPTAGMMCQFSEEALADCIHHAIVNSASFSPRASFLNTYGRIRVFNQCLDSLPYFTEQIPGYQSGEVHSNAWLTAAMQQAFGMTPTDWIYARSPLMHSYGLSQVEERLSRFLR